MDSRIRGEAMNSSTGVTSIKASLARVGNFVEKHKTAVMVTTMICFAFLLTMGTQSFADNTIWGVAEEASKDLITNIKNLYCKAIFPLAAVIALIAMVLTKDEKKLAVEKKALVTLIVVFIAIYGVYVLRDTVEQLATKVSGASV